MQEAPQCKLFVTVSAFPSIISAEDILETAGDTLLRSYLLFAGPASSSAVAEEEVRLLIDLLGTFPKPSSVPVFLKKRRKTSRALHLLDHVRPVESDLERLLFLKAYDLATTRKNVGIKTDWTALTRDFNLEVCKIWEEEKAVCHVYLKEEKHLRDYEKLLVGKGSQMEVARAQSILQAAKSPSVATQQTQPPVSQPPRPAPPVKKMGSGRGGKGSTRGCDDCQRAVCQGFVPKLGHLCVEFLISRGIDPAVREYSRQKMQPKHNGMTIAQAEEILAKQLKTCQADKLRKDRKKLLDRG